MQSEERVHDQVRIGLVDDTDVGYLVMERGNTPINSFTASKVDGMSDGLEELNGIADCLVLYGEPEFSVGADLRSIQETPEAMRSTRIDDIAAASNRFIRGLRDFPAPVIAAVRNVAAGGGLGFALASDLITMHDEAVLDTAYSRIGLTPDNATPYYLTQALGPYRAREVLFNPEPITASQAINFGLATRRYEGPESDFLDAVLERAATLADGPTHVYDVTKELVDTASEESLDHHLERERDAIREMSESEIFDEGLSAFLEKRDPNWT